MVWFQCEDCGENLKKPKLPNHFRICSAYKLSCIDCGEIFSQESVQGHTQCISEAEKYGPKNEGKMLIGTSRKSKAGSNLASNIDINVGLSSHPPWFCSLCKTNATSKQTLLLHAEGKKHRAKARAYHASSTNQTQEFTPGLNSSNDGSKSELTNQNLSKSEKSFGKDGSNTGVLHSVKDTTLKKKRKIDEFKTEITETIQNCDDIDDISAGEVIQMEKSKVELEKLEKKHKTEENRRDIASSENIKWKKLITKLLKSSSDGSLKMKKLKKLALESLQESGTTINKDELSAKLLQKVKSSSRFRLDNKLVRLAKEN